MNGAIMMMEDAIMINPYRLSDFEHPLIQAKAIELTQGEGTVLGKLERIFTYVRDEIKFGFPPKSWTYMMRASETIRQGMGHCGTKSALFVALCRVAGITAMVHCASLEFEELFFGMNFRSPPKLSNHVWVDVQIDGQWKSIDSFIVDKPLYEAALRKLKESGRTMGYGIALINGKSSCEFNFGEKGYEQMGAILEDHGRWEDLSEYYSSRFMTLTATNTLIFNLFAPLLSLVVNRKIERVRSTYMANPSL